MTNAEHQRQGFKLEISTWQKAVEIAVKLKNFFFRGQSDAKWGLKTSIERTVEHERRRESERELLYNFKRMAHHYISDLPGENENLEWLALLQHYGGKTRLLDFAYSFYVAAYFATENLDESVDGAIWAINGPEIKNPITKRFRYNGHRVGENEIEKHREEFEKFFKNPPDDKFVCFTEPRRLNKRIAAQQGLFLCPSQVDCTFEKCLISSMKMEKDDIKNNTPLDKTLTPVNSLSEMGENRDTIICVVKIIIPANVKIKIQTELVKMNITAAALFPGFDGYVKSLWHTWHLKDYEQRLKK